MIGWRKGEVDERKNQKWKDACINCLEWKDEWINKWIKKLLDDWINEWINE